MLSMRKFLGGFERECMHIALKPLVEKTEQLKMLHVGGQLRYNHDDCPAGTDTRQRLYIKRTSDSYIAFCHNCGNSGVLTVSNDGFRKTRTGDATYTKGLHVVPMTSLFTPEGLLNNCTQRMSEFGAAALAWLYSYQITQEDVIKYHIYFSKTKNSIIMYPKKTISVERTFKVSSPKYIMEKAVPDVNRNTFLRGKHNRLPLLIVEDYISGIRYHKLGLNVLVLLGTNFANETFIDASLMDVLANAPIAIHLDADHAGRVASNKIKKALSALSTKIQIVTELPQPKELNDLILKRVAMWAEEPERVPHPDDHRTFDEYVSRICSS